MLPTDAKARKDAPMDRGLLKYFPDACAAVAELSRVGNEQHNPGQPMHWAREKSTDHGDCIVRHQAEAGTVDSDGMRHSTKVAWRALAQLQLEIEAAQKKDDGWIEFDDARDCPPNAGHVYLRVNWALSGVKDSLVSFPACTVKWTGRDYGRIVAYRMVGE